MLLEDEEKEVIKALNENLDVSIEKYCNEHTIKIFKVVIQGSNSSNAQTPVNASNKNTKIFTYDFSTSVTKNGKEEKKIGAKSLKIWSINY